MVWVLKKPDGTYYRNRNGVPLFYSTKREARAAALALGLQNFTIVQMRD